jgi:hypothetical protein
VIAHGEDPRAWRPALSARSANSRPAAVINNPRTFAKNNGRSGDAAN